MRWPLEVTPSFLLVLAIRPLTETGFRSELTEKMALFKITDPMPEDEGSVPASFGTGGRTGHEVEAAGAILYLASIAGAYSNGITLLADGGSTVVMPSTYG